MYDVYILYMIIHNKTDNETKREWQLKIMISTDYSSKIDVSKASHTSPIY